MKSAIPATRQRAQAQARAPVAKPATLAQASPARAAWDCPTPAAGPSFAGLMMGGGPAARPSRSAHAAHALGAHGWHRPAEGASPGGRLFLQRRCACGGSAATPQSGTCTECEEKRLQARLTLGASHDPLELEADRVADQALAWSAQRPRGTEPLRIQRAPATGTEASTAQAPSSVERVVASAGKPLQPALRQDMEQRFGHDFSAVRVHDDGAARQSAGEIAAQAYTVGKHVVFGEGRHDPGTHAGRHLIAHELAHVVQQTGSVPAAARSQGVQRQQAATDPGAASGGTTAPVRHDCDINESNPIIWFDYNSTNIRTSGGVNSIVHLMAAIRRAQTHIAAAGSDSRIHLTGYASEEGDATRNRDLARRRADTIKSLMEDAGVPGAHLVATGFGEDTSMGSRPLNRRVEVCPTPAIEYIDMPEEVVPGESMDCAHPVKAGSLTQYAFLVRCLEAQLAATHGPVDILRTLRELYYGGGAFDNAACGDSESGTIGTLYMTAPLLMAALTASKVTDGVDVGHIFTGLEAMLCPRTRTDPAWYAPSVNMSNEDFLTWGGDIGSAAAGRLNGYNDSGWVFRSAPPWNKYFLTKDTLASQEDLRGDIDAFVMRANLSGLPCASTKDTRMPSPSTPISAMLLDFYGAPAGMAAGLTSADRFNCFAQAAGATLSGRSITNKPALVSRYTPQVFSFAHLFYLGMSKAHVLTWDFEDAIRLSVYSEEITGKFFDWVDTNL